MTSEKPEKNQNSQDHVKAQLSYRKHLKTRKPNFIRQDAHKKMRLGEKWRKPKGIQSKMRLHRRGYRKSVSKGYKSPKAIRGTICDGLFPVYVDNISKLEGIDSKTQAIIIMAKTGVRKKVEIVKKAQELKILIANVKDPVKYLQEVVDKQKQKSKVKKQKAKDKEEKKKKLDKKLDKEAKKKDSIENIADEAGDKLEKEKKKERDKLLTAKDGGY
ncbi:50S ribosomal protein L32e [Candidatus Woesearchaeota archaeon]|jgi:large subunit ribosomal protein L32e|nr:50S ribosomal protein L32e [Candidatus Woesearchaeota archaeon]MBT5271913.1 50S ribosomal protein L32e [Candidatus Woesearchaeota archaeon]MBT6041025.1 50S ribosomal protein L32e [Candidatus Woesearchaeota archaeon]MBT6336201.1 50S ribosomal protein L32e [Candidatus Woesearchaeota archaeon]MBT7928032.1 50S ribosomal protein L32e [Candidatus Woesearchaeota archaeon]